MIERVIIAIDKCSVSKVNLQLNILFYFSIIINLLMNIMDNKLKLSHHTITTGIVFININTTYLS